MVNYWQSSTGLPLTDTNHKSLAINYRTCTGDEEQNTPSYVPTYVHGLSQAETAPGHTHTHPHLNGHINMPEIERKSKNCRFPGSPAHSEVFFSDEALGPGSIATYTCERGFELLGPSRRTCVNGDWVPEGIPFCDPRDTTNRLTQYYVGTQRCVLIQGGETKTSERYTN
ncbi:hypothetical protein RUM43_002654 [Polyplax serrata]|uniref:Sushi domain-containing protein n=1 Tax=Polyplax serrata TaxID=468196 RepID=A0AAN8RW20_POLSC